MMLSFGRTSRAPLALAAMLASQTMPANADQWIKFVSASCAPDSFDQRLEGRFNVSLLSADAGGGGDNTASTLGVLQVSDIEEDKGLWCTVGGHDIGFRSVDVKVSDGLGTCASSQEATLELLIDGTVVFQMEPTSDRIRDLGAEVGSRSCASVSDISFEVTEAYVNICTSSFVDVDGDAHFRWNNENLGWSTAPAPHNCTTMYTDRLIEAVERFDAPLKG